MSDLAKRLKVHLQPLGMLMVNIKNINQAKCIQKNRFEISVKHLADGHKKS